MWLEKGFFDNAVSLRLGQLAADDEFVTSQYAAALVNSTFGWPAIASLALPSGGPAYPLATPGIRVKAALSDAIAIQLAVFNGDPAGGASQIDPQLRDNTGIAFNLNRGPFALAEASWAVGAQSEAAAPASILKLGAWYHADRFGDIALDRNGYLLSDTRSSGLFYRRSVAFPRAGHRRSGAGHLSAPVGGAPRSKLYFRLCRFRPVL
jgi:porin